MEYKQETIDKVIIVKCALKEKQPRVEDEQEILSIA